MGRLLPFGVTAHSSALEKKGIVKEAHNSIVWKRTSLTTLGPVGRANIGALCAD